MVRVAQHWPALLLTGLVPAAQAATPEDLLALSLEELLATRVVTTASRHAQRLADAPASTTVVEADEIRRYGYRTLSELLAAQRSFYLADDRNYTYVGIRGIARPGDFNSRILLLVNGQRINDNFFDSAFVGHEFPIDIELVRRVEIVRGPGSSLYGANALFAVINVITDGDPELRRAGVEIGSLGSRKAHATVTARVGGEGMLRVFASRFRADGEASVFYPEFDDPSTNAGRYEGNDQEEATRSFVELRSGRFRASAFHSSRTRSLPTASYGTAFNAPGGFTTDRKTHWNLGWRDTLAHGTDYALILYGDRYDYTGDYVYDIPPLTVNRDAIVMDTVGFEATATRRLGAHVLTYGAEWRDDHDYRQRNFDVAPFVSNLDRRGRQRYRALFAQADLSGGTRWRWTAGARLDDYAEFGSALNPRVSVVFSADPASVWKMLVGRAFRIPSVSDRTLFPGLGAETVRSAELVYERRVGESVQVFASVFRNEIRGLITAAFDDGLQDSVLFNDPDGIASTGLEFGVDLQMPGALQAGLSLGFNRTSDDNPIVAINSPRRLAKGQISLPIAMEGLRLGTQFDYLGARPTLAGGIADGRLLTHTTLSYDPPGEGAWDASLSAYNLFDVDHADPATVNHRQSEIPRYGREWRLQWRYRF